MKVFEFFARRHVLATLFTVSIVMLGLNSLRTLKRDQFPEVDFGEVVVSTTYPGASPEDVELNVTNKIEDELKNVTGIDRITSISTENRSIINIVIQPDVSDLDKVKDDIRDAVNRVTDFPEEVTESPLITELDTATVIEVIEVGIAGDVPYAELREVARDFEKKLKEVPGVSRIDTYGYRMREIQVLVDPARMEQYQIPLREIIGAIEARNIRLTGGTFESYTSEKNVVTLAEFDNPLEVGDVIVRSTFEGPLIKVSDLAVIREDFEDETIIPRMDGRKVITFEVYKNENADIIRTVRGVKKLIEEESGRGMVAGYVPVETGEEAERDRVSFIDKLLGRGGAEPHVFRYGSVQILTANDRSRTVESSFRIVLNNGAIGLLLVVLVLTVFLNLRTAFWVAMGIPVSILGTVFLLPFFGSFLDTISLASIILVIGIIVDDGIIISESIAYRRSIGDSPIDAAVNGLKAVFFPVLTTVLTTFLAFAPMFFMSGIMGKFVFVIPLTVSLALFISLGESTIALPAHLKHGMDKSAGRVGAGAGGTATVSVNRRAARKWFNALRRFYRKLLYRLLKVRYGLVALFVGALAAAVWYAGNNMNFILFPSKGADTFYIGVELPTGASLTATTEKVRQVEAAVQELPPDELETFITRIGTLGWVWNGEGENFAFLLVNLTPYSERVRTADDIVDEVRRKIEAIEGVENSLFYIDAGGPPVGKPVTLRLIGSDDGLREALTEEVVGILESVEGVTDIDRDDKTGKEQIEIDIDYRRLARRGLTVSDVAQNVRIAYDGQVVTSIREGDEDVDFRVRLDDRARRNIGFLERLNVPNQQGRLIRLGDVATLVSGPGPNALYHFDGERTTTVEADLDTDVITALEATNRVLERIDLDEWPGMQIRVGGEAEESMESLMSLFITFIIAFVGIYFLLILLFNSFTQPFLVMIAIPFGLVGVIVALALHNEPLSFLAMIGTIGLAGVVVNDSLVLVNHINEIRALKPDEPVRKVVAEATSNRLRAIILTTLTTVAGLLPLAYGIGGTALYMAPMALVLGYGLIFATPLTLVLIPSLYVIGTDIGRLFRRR
jgi:multidrug efflux pump subunit AcrB